MTLKVKFNVFLFLCAFLAAGVGFTACGSDNEDEPESGFSIEGSWKCSYDSEAFYLVFGNGVGFYKEEDLDNKGFYTDAESFTWSYKSESKVVIDCNNDNYEVRILSDDSIEFDGDIYRRCKSGDVPQEPAEEESNGRDELSNSSWKMVSIIDKRMGKDWAVIEGYKNDIWEFGANGSITVRRNSGGTSSGSYTLDGNAIKLTGLGLYTNNYGWDYTYTISSNKLVMIDKWGEHTFTFSRN